jgi:uncharacterized protein with HEPN domain
MRSDRDRFLDIFEAIEKIDQYSIQGKQAFETNELIQVWIVRNLQIIGEASDRISLETQNRFPSIPWKKIIGMRHVLVHGYFDIDLAIVWSVIENDLPSLKDQVQKALQD